MNSARDDRVLWDVVFGVHGYPAVLLAHKLGVFALLEDRSLSLSAICTELKTAQRPTRGILTAAAALDLLDYRDDRYTLTGLAREYLLESSPTYFGGQFDLTIDNYAMCSLENMEAVVRNDNPEVYGAAKDMFESHAEQSALAREFTRAQHSISIGPASAWPEVVDLSTSRLMLDVGGGSGSHCMAAVRRWPQLQAIVLDIEPVCEVADEFIAQQKLQNRIETQAGDMWRDPLPRADVHFYSMIFHDWAPEKCRRLVAKSFENLEAGGHIIIHEMLYDETKTGPFPVAAHNIIMMLWTEGQQYSGTELSSMLSEAGFATVEVKSAFGYFSIVTGRKP